MDFDKKILELNIKLPDAKAPVGSYVATKVVSKLLFISGQISINEKGELTTNDGKVIVATGLKKTALWQCMTDMCKGVVTQGKLKGHFEGLNYTDLDNPLLAISS